MATVTAASAVLLASCATDPRAEAASAGASQPDLGRDTALAADSDLALSPRFATSVEEHLDPSCASPATVDQERCLSAYLAPSDLVLDRYFRALILRLEAEAGVAAGAAEPPAVQRLRAAQRAWVAYRDEECRKWTREREGPLWAPVRARCLIDYSTQRADELAGVLVERKAVAPFEQPTPSAQPTPSKQRTPSTKPAPSKRQPSAKPTTSKRSRARTSAHHTRKHQR